jgi:replicative DNA helicase
MGREPPRALDAERSLLGGLFLTPDAMDYVHQLLEPEDFFSPAHRKVYEAILALFSKSQPFDRITVKEALVASGQMESIGGEEFVDLLDKWVPEKASLNIYAKLIAEKSTARKLIEAATGICTLGYEQHGEMGEFADECERRIMAAGERRKRGSDPQFVREILAATYKQIETDYERQSAVTGVASGLRDLDVLTAGFQPGDLIILAARPSVGKTACGLGWAAHVALHLDRGALVFSMEMSKTQLMKRLLASEARVDSQRIRTGLLLASDWPKLSAASGRVGDAPLIIDDSRNLSVLDIRSIARRQEKKLAAAKKPLSFIVVDYLTMMRTENTDETLSTKVGRNALRLKHLAGELNVPIVLLAQLNRENSKGGKPRRPVLSDLRDSGEIEQHGDVVVFIHREERKDQPDTHELLIEKQRNGPIGIVPVVFNPANTRFEDAAKFSQHPPHYSEAGGGA